MDASAFCEEVYKFVSKPLTRLLRTRRDGGTGNTGLLHTGREGQGTQNYSTLGGRDREQDYSTLGQRDREHKTTPHWEGGTGNKTTPHWEGGTGNKTTPH